MDLKRYISPIYCGGTIIGQGFVADGYFITAAHVVKDFPSCFTELNGLKRELSNEEPFNSIEGDIYHDENMIDVVLYPCDEIYSPLHLSNYIPKQGDQFESYCVHEVSTPFSLTQMVPLNPTYEQSVEPAIVVKEEIGNYFYCVCKRLGGSSGSPLLKDNNVVGIMHGGNDEGLCAFLKSEVVLKNYIHQIKRTRKIILR